MNMKAHVSDRLNEDDGQLNAELTRVETENRRLKDEFLRLIIQYSRYASIDVLFTICTLSSVNFGTNIISNLLLSYF